MQLQLSSRNERFAQMGTLSAKFPDDDRYAITIETLPNGGMKADGTFGRAGDSTDFDFSTGFEPREFTAWLALHGVADRGEIPDELMIHLGESLAATAREKQAIEAGIDEPSVDTPPCNFDKMSLEGLLLHLRGAMNGLLVESKATSSPDQPIKRLGDSFDKPGGSDLHGFKPQSEHAFPVPDPAAAHRKPN